MACKRKADVLLGAFLLDHGGDCAPSKTRLRLNEEEDGATESKTEVEGEAAGTTPRAPPKPMAKKHPDFRTATKTRCCALGLASFPPGKAKTFRKRIEEEVAAVSEASRKGSRFLELQLRLILQRSGDGRLPEILKTPKPPRKRRASSDKPPLGTNSPQSGKPRVRVPKAAPMEPKKPKEPKIHVPGFPIKQAVCQAFAAMQKGAKPIDILPGYREAKAEWAKIDPGKGVRLQAPNSLTYASNAFYSTLLSNYTKIALPRHVFWTLRHLYPDQTRDLKDVLIGGADLAGIQPALPALSCDLILECQVIQEAEYSEAMACRAISLRWKCLELLDAAGPRTIELKSGDKKELQPKRFALVPQCRKASRFITLDRQWANKMLGLSLTSKVKEHPLRECFCNNADVRKWCGSPGSRFAKFPDTVRTDGVQLHVPFEEDVPFGELPEMKDFRSRDPCELLKQFASGRPHGLFHLEAATGLGATHPSFANSVGVDPGVINLVTTDGGMKITRGDFYGKRRPVTARGPARPVVRTDDQGQEFRLHSRATRRNQIPQSIQTIQDNLKTHGLASGGRDQMSFVDNLTAWLNSEKDLRTYYGSRTQRTVRLVRASRARCSMASVVNLVAPDPTTVVLFGANFFGRHCKKGDVAGPVAVKGIRRALAKQRVVITIDEFNTTKCHLECGKELDVDPDDSHEKVCRTCGEKVDRDRNAARNIKAVWQHHLIHQDGSRPAHLERPKHLVPVAVFPLRVIAP